ncbi:MAG: STAS domain-containing protein [Ruminococcaceae bacterium]|nr:STAS domain-containing protein [Oscillospiraceae bacterium]
MTIQKTIEGSAMTLGIEGRLETTTAPSLEEVIRNELEGITELTFDFSQLEYISSAGLRVILAAQKIMNNQGSMRVTGANDIVMEVFELTGFADIITIE